MYIDKLGQIADKYARTYYRSIRMKPANFNPGTNFDYRVEHNELKDSKFKVGDHVRISKYKNIFSQAYTPNLSDEFCAIKKVNNSVP